MFSLGSKLEKDHLLLRINGEVEYLCEISKMLLSPLSVKGLSVRPRCNTCHSANISSVIFNFISLTSLAYRNIHC